MHPNTLLAVRAAGLATLITGGLLYESALAKDIDVSNEGPGRVSFDVPDLPKPSVEIDLGQGLIRHAISLGDAAVAGFLEGLTGSQNADTKQSVEYITQQLSGARELGDTLGEVVQEVHIRAWENLESEAAPAETALLYFNDRLQAQGWESTVRAREGTKSACVFVLREGDSLRGVFIIAGENKKLALVNAIGDLSPENVHRLTETATRIGVELGLDKELNKAVEKARREQARR